MMHTLQQHRSHSDDRKKTQSIHKKKSATDSFQRSGLIHRLLAKVTSIIHVAGM